MAPSPRTPEVPLSQPPGIRVRQDPEAQPAQEVPLPDSFVEAADIAFFKRLNRENEYLRVRFAAHRERQLLDLDMPRTFQAHYLVRRHSHFLRSSRTYTRDACVGKPPTSQGHAGTCVSATATQVRVRICRCVVQASSSSVG